MNELERKKKDDTEWITEGTRIYGRLWLTGKNGAKRLLRQKQPVLAYSNVTTHAAGNVMTVGFPSGPLL